MLQRNFLLLSVLVPAVLSGGGCGRSDAAVEKDLREVVEKNLRASQDEDLDRLCDTVNDAAREQVRAAMAQVFQRCDLAYTLTEFQVVSVEKAAARVKVSQEVRRLRGEPFSDRRLTLIHTLVKVRGKWKISATEIIRFDRL